MKLTEEIISYISAWTQTSVDTYQDKIYVWTINDTDIVYDKDNREIKVVDYDLDNKLYFSLVGLAHSRKLKFGDYYSS